MQALLQIPFSPLNLQSQTFACHAIAQPVIPALHSKRLHALTPLQAVRRQSATQLEPKPSEVSPEVDADFLEAFNELCTGAVRAMLSGDPWQVERYLDRVDEAGNIFAQEDNREATLFVWVLYNICKNKLVKQHTQLTGIYEDAFHRIFALLEDSGWQLVKEGEEAKQEHVDAEVLQPPPNSVLQNYS